MGVYQINSRHRLFKGNCCSLQIGDLPLIVWRPKESLNKGPIVRLSDRLDWKAINGIFVTIERPFTDVLSITVPF